MLLMIDNYDSFTYNLVQYFGELGEDVQVYRNDKISLSEIEALKPRRLVISPGALHAEGSGYFGGGDPVFRRKIAVARGLSGPPISRRGFRR